MSPAQTSSLRGDIYGGVSAAVVALPLAIAFGVAAMGTMGPEYASFGAMVGLLGAIFTGFFAAAFGGTPVQITGPTGPMTVVATAFIAELVARHGPAWPTISLLLALAIISGGFFQIVMGSVGGGRLVKFIPYSVVAGFMNGIAIIIFLTQVKPFAGVVGDWDGFSFNNSWVPMLVACVTMAVMVTSKKRSPHIPDALAALAAGIVTYLVLAGLGLAPFTNEKNQLLIGEIPNPFTSWEQMQQLMPVFKLEAIQAIEKADVIKSVVAGMAFGILGAIDSLLTSLVADSITHSRHDSRKELIGQGIGNIVSGLGGGLAGAGATVRTLVNVNAGGRSKYSGMIHAATVFLVVLVLSAPAGWIPRAALAGILFVTAVGMIDYYSLRLIRRRNVRGEFAVVVLVTAVTVLVDLMIAVAVGMVIATFLFMFQQVRQAVLHRRMLGSEVFSRRVRFKGEMDILKQRGSQTIIYELKDSLFFGTTDKFIEDVAADFENGRFFIFDFSRVDDIDLSGVRVLQSIVDRIRESGNAVYFTGLHVLEGESPVYMHEILNELGVLDHVGRENVLISLDRAMELVEDKLLSEAGVNISRDDQPLMLEEFGIFSSLSRDQLGQLQQHVTELTTLEGEYLLKIGDQNSNLLLVRRGRLGVMRRTARGFTRLSVIGPGGMLGLRAFVDGEENLSSGVLAKSDVSVYAIPVDRLNELAVSCPELAIKMQREIIRNFIGRLDVMSSELILLEQH